MLEIIFKSLFAILAIIGAVEIIRLILFRILKTDNPGKFMLLVSFSGHDEKAEYSLRSAMERARWMSDDVQVVCMDRGMDYDTRQVCEMVCADNPEIILCTPDEFQKFWMN
ncbi:MAG TPA: hypothetical protein VHP31_00730 [Caproicibacter sp.]|nr:hypothetical protein [Caproicibacter sp.]